MGLVSLASSPSFSSMASGLDVPLEPPPLCWEKGFCIALEVFCLNIETSSRLRLRGRNRWETSVSSPLFHRVAVEGRWIDPHLFCPRAVSTRSLSDPTRFGLRHQDRSSSRRFGRSFWCSHLFGQKYCSCVSYGHIINMFSVANFSPCSVSP